MKRTKTVCQNVVLLVLTDIASYVGLPRTCKKNTLEKQKKIHYRKLSFFAHAGKAWVRGYNRHGSWEVHIYLCIDGDSIFFYVKVTV